MYLSVRTHTTSFSVFPSPWPSSHLEYSSACMHDFGELSTTGFDIKIYCKGCLCVCAWYWCLCVKMVSSYKLVLSYSAWSPPPAFKPLPFCVLSSISYLTLLPLSRRVPLCILRCHVVQCRSTPDFRERAKKQITNGGTGSRSCIYLSLHSSCLVILCMHCVHVHLFVLSGCTCLNLCSYVLSACFMCCTFKA